ncbi:hypothetical protein [Aestuariivivens marinum]|uniref:hypothetical protein n=1 Tax=Aestuariivivens marinum TaxID=2913555 RepID=UPI001F5788F9|nr:hypothetical protein [Aestuariivivens marinum]
MYKPKFFLESIVPIVYIVFVVFLITGRDSLAYSVSSLLSPAIALLYFTLVKKKTISVSLFLIFFSVSDLMVLFDDHIPYKINYFVGNSLYVLAYTSLLFKFLTKSYVEYSLKNFKIHIIILTVLNVYILYVLQDSIARDRVPTPSEYIMELTYNIVMLILLSLSLLNYFYRDDKKSLLLFIGSLCIVFGEVLGIAYLYMANMANEGVFNFLSTTLYLIAFCFFYWQSKLTFDMSNTFVIEEV